MNENITPLPLPLRVNQVNAGLPDTNADGKHNYKPVYIQPLNLKVGDKSTALPIATQLIEACNAYPALTARVKELEEALHGCFDELTNLGSEAACVFDAQAALNKEPTT